METAGITETQQRILRVAREEFLARGFKDASLRGIVKKAGFTQGAFYGYYDSKEALFADLVSPADDLVTQFKAAQQSHFDLIPAGKTDTSVQLSTEYLFGFLDFIYQHLDAFKLVLCRSAGTRYAHYIDDLVDLQVSVAQDYLDRLRAEGLLSGDVDSRFHRMITSAYFTAVFETVVRDMPYDEARTLVENLAAFFNSGWKRFLDFK